MWDKHTKWLAYFLITLSFGLFLVSVIDTIKSKEESRDESYNIKWKSKITDKIGVGVTLFSQQEALEFPEINHGIEDPSLFKILITEDPPLLLILVTKDPPPPVEDAQMRLCLYDGKLTITCGENVDMDELSTVFFNEILKPMVDMYIEGARNETK